MIISIGIYNLIGRFLSALRLLYFYVTLVVFYLFPSCSLLYLCLLLCTFYFRKWTIKMILYNNKNIIGFVLYSGCLSIRCVSFTPVSIAVLGMSSLYKTSYFKFTTSPQLAICLYCLGCECMQAAYPLVHIHENVT